MSDATCQVLRLLGAAMMGAGFYGFLLRQRAAHDATEVAVPVARLQDELEARSREVRDAVAERDRLRAALSRASGERQARGPTDD